VRTRSVPLDCWDLSRIGSSVCSSVGGIGDVGDAAPAEARDRARATPSTVVLCTRVHDYVNFAVGEDALFGSGGRPIPQPRWEQGPESIVVTVVHEMHASTHGKPDGGDAMAQETHARTHGMPDGGDAATYEMQARTRGAKTNAARGASSCVHIDTDNDHVASTTHCVTPSEGRS
jgi:hypothetical protein